MNEIKPTCPWHFIAMACTSEPALQLRSEKAADEPWRRELFARLRGLHPAILATCPALLEQQWQLQHQAFLNHYPGAQTRIIWSGNQAIGVITLYRRLNAWRLVEIGLEPDCCGQGIGGRLLRGLTRFADEQRQTLELAVMRHNPALSLYRRLGFVGLAESEDGVQLQMRRTPL